MKLKIVRNNRKVTYMEEIDQPVDDHTETKELMKIIQTSKLTLSRNASSLT